MSWSGSASRPEAAGELDSSGGRGASGHYVPPQEWKVGMILGKDLSSGTSVPGNSHTPFPAVQSLTLPCWALRCGRHIAEGATTASGPWYVCPHTHGVYNLTYLQIFPESYVHTVTNTLMSILRNTFTHPQPRGHTLNYIHMHTCTHRS